LLVWFDFLDMQEAQSLENRLMLAQQESWNLRESLMTAGARQTLTGFGTAATAPSALPLELHTATHDGRQQQQHSNGLSGLAASAAGTSPGSGVLDYQAKLQQIRELREKLKPGDAKQQPAAADEFGVAGLRVCSRKSRAQPAVGAAGTPSSVAACVDVSSARSEPSAEQGNRSLQAAEKMSSSCQHVPRGSQRWCKTTSSRHSASCGAAEAEEYAVSDAVLCAAHPDTAKPANWSALMRPAAAAADQMKTPVSVDRNASTGAAAAGTTLSQQLAPRVVDDCAAGVYKTAARHK